MPVRSKAMWRFMQWRAHGKGEAGKKGPSRSVAQEFLDATPSYKSLPERVGKKKDKH